MKDGTELNKRGDEGTEESEKGGRGREGRGGEGQARGAKGVKGRTYLSPPVTNCRQENGFPVIK